MPSVSVSPIPNVPTVPPKKCVQTGCHESCPLSKTGGGFLLKTSGGKGVENGRVLKLHLFVLFKEDMNCATSVPFNQGGGHTLPSLDPDLSHSEFFHPILTIWHPLVDD